MAEIVVADAGPLIALGRLRKIELLARIFAKVIVPRTVFEETQFRPDLPDARAIVAARQSGVFIVDNSSAGSPDVPTDGELGDGEAAAISLAAALGHGVLIDDKHGRAVAVALNLRIIGTLCSQPRVAVLAVVHQSRNPATWPRRSGSARQGGA